MTQQYNDPYGYDPRRQRSAGSSRRPAEGGNVHQQYSARANREAHQNAYAHNAQAGQVPRGYSNDASYGRRGAAPARGQGQAAYGRTNAASYNRAHAQAGRSRATNGTGTTEYSDYSRYVNQRQQRRRKNPIAIVATLVVLAAIGVGVYFYLNPLSFDVTINGVKHTVDRGTTIEKVLDEGLATPTAGNLLAIDGSVATQGGGDRFSATINGQATTDATVVLRKNDVIDFSNGADATETFHSSTEEIPYERVEDSNYWNGSLHVYINGVNGVRTTKTGDVSGITLTEDTQPVVNEEYKIYTADTGDDKVIALTFDDGPWPTTTEAILDILEENDAKATFFTIGNQISDHTSSVKRASDMGCQICTHTWDHASGSGQGVNLTYMTADEQITEVQKGMEAVATATGLPSSTVMRAPGGNFHGDIIWTLQPYITAEVGWDVDTEDWRRPGADTIASRILSAKSGDVILMHDGGGDRTQTVEALRQALPQLKAQGYRFITVDEMLAYGVPQSS